MDQDPVDPDARAEQRANAAKLQKFKRRTINEAVLWLMKHAQGRRIVWQLLQEARVFCSSFDASPYTTAFREGQRDFGLRVTNLFLGACPQLYTKMIEECGRDDGDSSTS